MSKISKPQVNRVGWAGVGLERRIEAENKTRAAVEKASQRDDQYETVYDEERCAPSTVVAATALAGSNQMLGLLAGLKYQRDGHNPLFPAQLSRKLDVMDARVRDGKALDHRQLQQLQDMLHATGQADLNPVDSNDADFIRQLKIAGFHGRAVQTPLREGLTAEQRRAGVRSLVRELYPGEMTTLVVEAANNPNARHGVLLGRANDGSYFMYDSAAPDPSNCLYEWDGTSETSETAAIRNLLGRAVRVAGQTDQTPHGVIFSASPYQLD